VSQLAPIIACDLGAECAAVLVTGTFNCPVLLDARRWSHWDPEKIVAQLRTWRRSKRGRDAKMWCEDTFSGPKWLRDVGRKQEAQAGLLQGIMGDVFERVPPVSAVEADLAWNAFGRPALGQGDAGEHVRDALGTAWKALNRRNDTAQEWIARTALGREGGARRRTD
jgi:hypothetical protein